MYTSATSITNTVQEVTVWKTNLGASFTDESSDTDEHEATKQDESLRMSAFVQTVERKRCVYNYLQNSDNLLNFWNQTVIKASMSIEAYKDGDHNRDNNVAGRHQPVNSGMSIFQLQPKPFKKILRITNIEPKNYLSP